MGVSTDAYLVYGFQIEEGSDERDTIAEFRDERYDEFCKIKKRLDATIVEHCSNECPMYIVGVKSTEQWAWRGNPCVVDVEALAEHYHLDLNKKLDDIAAALGVTPKKGQWLLVSYWG